MAGETGNEPELHIPRYRTDKIVESHRMATRLGGEILVKANETYDSPVLWLDPDNQPKISDRTLARIVQQEFYPTDADRSEQDAAARFAETLVESDISDDESDEMIDEFLNR